MIKIVFKLLIRAMQMANLIDENVKSDIMQLPNNYVIKFNVLPKNINVFLRVQNGRIERIKDSETPDLILEFKDQKSALKTLFGIISIADAFAEHRIKVYGNLNNGMILTRIINTVECYLFPNFMTKRLFKPLPELKGKKSTFYWKLIFGKTKIKEQKLSSGEKI